MAALVVLASACATTEQNHAKRSGGGGVQSAGETVNPPTVNLWDPLDSGADCQPRIGDGPYRATECSDVTGNISAGP